MRIAAGAQRTLGGLHHHGPRGPAGAVQQRVGFVPRVSHCSSGRSSSSGSAPWTARVLVPVRSEASQPPAALPHLERPSPSQLLEEIVDPVVADMEAMNQNLRHIVGDRHPMLLAAADQIFGAGGKKLRPMIVLLMARATAEMAGLRCGAAAGQGRPDAARAAEGHTRPVAACARPRAGGMPATRPAAAQPPAPDPSLRGPRRSHGSAAGTQHPAIGRGAARASAPATSALPFHAPQARPPPTPPPTPAPAPLRAATSCLTTGGWLRSLR
jgi:hypothetical protein